MFEDITQSCKVGDIEFLIPEDRYEQGSARTRKLLAEHKERMKALKSRIDSAYKALIDAHVLVGEEYAFSQSGEDAFEPGCHILNMGISNDHLLKRIRALKAESDSVFKEYS